MFLIRTVIYCSVYIIIKQTFFTSNFHVEVTSLYTFFLLQTRFFDLRLPEEFDLLSSLFFSFTLHLFPSL